MELGSDAGRQTKVPGGGGGAGGRLLAKALLLRGRGCSPGTDQSKYNFPVTTHEGEGGFTGGVVQLK